MSRAWMDGEWVAEHGAGAWAGESGLLTGDGVFETLRVEAGHLLDPEAHVQRLTEGLEALELSTPEGPGNLMHVASRLAEELPRGPARLRITVARRDGDRPPLRLIHAAPYAPPSPEEYRRGVPVITLELPRVDPRDPLTGIKSLSWGRQAWAARRARHRGVFEALLFDLEDRLAEASRCNVVVRVDGGLKTPPLATGCLPGTVRRRLLEADAVEEAPLSRRRLAEVEELLLTNSLVGVLPVSTLDGRALRVGPTVARLAEVLPR